MKRRATDLLSEASKLLERGEYEAAISRLNGLVNSKNGSLTSRLEAIRISASACQSLSWYEEEVELRRRALRLASVAGESEARERASLAIALISLGRLNEAQSQIAPVVKKWGRQEWAEALRIKAIITMRGDRDYPGAAAMVREAIHTLGEGGPSFELGRLHVLLGHLLRLSGNMQEAKRALSYAQRLLGDHLAGGRNALREYANAELFMGDVQRAAGGLQAAKGHYEHARSLFGRSPTARFLKLYYHRLGTLYFMLAEYKEAKKCYLHPELLSAVEKIGNTEGYFWCYLAAAKADTANCDAKQAEHYLSEAEKTMGKEPSPFILGHYEFAQADLAAARSKWEDADHLYQAAGNQFRKIGKEGHIPGVIDCTVGRGFVAVAQKDTEKALSFAFQCSELARNHHVMPLQARELLLKSTILAEGNRDLDELFQDVKAKLEVISSPVIMFKVVSNLYYYGRKFLDYETDVELEEKLLSLKAVLNGSVYQDLYHKYVEKRYESLIQDLLNAGYSQEGSANSR